MSRPVNLNDLIAVGISLTSGSFMVFGMGMNELLGPINMVQDQFAPMGLSRKQRVRMFSVWYKKAATLMVGAIFVGGLSSIYTALTIPNVDASRYAIGAAVGSLSIFPYTVFVMLPTNKRLLALEEKSQTTELSETDEKEIDRLMVKWGKMHAVRFIGYAGATIGSLLAGYEIVKRL